MYLYTLPVTSGTGAGGGVGVGAGGVGTGSLVTKNQSEELTGGDAKDDVFAVVHS